MTHSLSTPESLRLTLKTAPTEYPVTLNELKAQISEHSDFVDDDAMLTGMLATAVQAAEDRTGRVFMARTYQQFLDKWPVGIMRAHLAADDWWEGTREGAISQIPVGQRFLEVPRPPLISVDAIRTYDDADTPTTLASSNYFVDTATQPARIVLRTAAAVPNPTRVANGLEIEFTAGYGSTLSDTPEPIRQAILMCATWLYSNRGDCTPEQGLDQSGGGFLLNQYHILRV